MQTMTDAELLEAYSSRQDEPFGGAQGEAAFGELMGRHGAMVYRACLRLLKDSHEAEDASQAVFVVLARKAGKLRKGNLSSWLYRVAHLVAAEMVRKRMHRVSRESACVREEDIHVGANVISIDPVAEPMTVFGEVDEALLSLPERYREAVILRYLQNHSLEDAARLAGCAVGALKWRASQGIEMLRSTLTKRGVALGGAALAGLLASEASAAVPETLLPSILATVKTAVATTATATGASSTAAVLAKGAMKAMFIAKVKIVALVMAAAIAVGGAGVTAAVAVAEKSRNAKAPNQQIVSDKAIHPVQSAITDAPLEAEDLARALGLGYWAFSIQPVTNGYRGFALSLGWHKEGRAEHSYLKDFGVQFNDDSYKKVPQVRVVFQNTGAKQECIVHFFDQDWYRTTADWSGADLRRNLYINREPSMDDKGRVVLAFELPPGCDIPNAKLRSADGAYRALVLSVDNRNELQPTQFKPDMSRLPSTRLARLLDENLAHTTLRIEGADKWWGRLAYYAKGKKMPVGSSFSGSKERMTFLVREGKQEFSTVVTSPLTSFGTSISRNSSIIEEKMDNRAENKERDWYMGVGGVLGTVDQRMRFTEPDEQGRIVLRSISFVESSEKTRLSPEKTDEALVLQLGTGENGQIPLKRGQVYLEETQDKDLLPALSAYLNTYLHLQPLRVFNLAPPATPSFCRISRYVEGKREQTLAEALLDPADMGDPWRFAVFQKENADHRRIEGVVLANHITIPFRVDCAEQRYLVAQNRNVLPRALDGSGRLLLGCLVKADGAGVIDAMPDDVSIANAPEALVLELAEQ
ncbi:MAG: RNA polymerase sigma factor [bacterium]